ncbi:hypothetical protein ACP275_14G084000 [Erythranthe tilingii]
MSEEISSSSSKRPLDASVDESPEPTSSPSLTPTNTNEDIEVPGKKRQKSDVWLHFERVVYQGEPKAQCKYCNKYLTGKSTDGTSHLRDHIKKSCPRRKFKEIRDMRQQVLVNEQNKADGQLKPCHFDQAVARYELACMVILHELPLSIVDYVGFRKFAFALQPLFKMLSRNTIKGDIFKIYDIKREKIMAFIEKNHSRIAITTDMWTSSNRKRGFMVVTAHYIDDSWVLQNRLLRFIYVPSPHTGEVLSNVLMDCLLEWNIDQKLSTLMVDNCTTNDAMVRLLSDKLQTTSLVLHGSLLHMRCAAHILNLIVQDGLVVIKDCIEKIRDSVCYWTGSTKRRQKFEEVARQVRVSCTKELILDVKTRWNSTFLMLSTALIYKDVFFRLKQRDSSYSCMPSEDEWTLAKQICEKLELFYKVTEIFSGTSYPTANVYFSKICQIKIHITEWSTSLNEVIKKMALSMLGKFDFYWNAIHGIMGVAAILDPQFKMVLVEFLYGKIYGDLAFLEINKVKDICYKLLDEYSSKKRDSDGVSSPSSTVVDDSQSSRGDILLDYDLLVNSKKKKGDGKKELDHYLEDAVLPRSNDFDILSWWKNNGLKYPTLRLIARDVLAIPVSTVASESAFSTSGRLLSPHRSRLHSKTVEALMCSQNWLWAQTKGSSSQIVLEKAMQNVFDGEDDDGREIDDDGEDVLVN